MLEIQTAISETGLFADPLAKEQITQELKKYSGKRIVITIDDARKISKNQYGYLHAVIYPCISEQYKIDRVNDGLEWNKKEMHDFFCALFLPTKDIMHPYTGEIIGSTQMTTSDLKMRKMALEFMESVIKWAAEFMGLSIPQPDKNWRRNRTIIVNK